MKVDSPTRSARQSARTARTTSRAHPVPVRRNGRTALPERTKTPKTPKTLKTPKTSPKPALRPARLPFVLLIVTLLVGGLVSLLLLNIVLTEDSMRLTELKRDTVGLQQQTQQVRREIGKLESPAELARRARGENMVEPANPAFISKDTGEVLGRPQVARSPGQPQVDTHDGTSGNGIPRADAPDRGRGR